MDLNRKYLNNNHQGTTTMHDVMNHQLGPPKNWANDPCLHNLAAVSDCLCTLHSTLWAYSMKTEQILTVTFNIFLRD